MKNLVVFCAFLAVVAAEAPAIPKCKSDDSKCFKAAADALIPTFVAGIPELNTDVLDPLFLKEVDASTSTLKFIVTDSTVTQMKTCKAKSIKRDKQKMKMKFLCEKINVDGQYLMDGSLLFIPMKGKGKYENYLRNVTFNVDFTFVEIDVNGVKHWDIKDWSSSFDPESASLKFHNLFEGNQLLSTAANEVIKNNGRIINLELGPPVLKSIWAAIAASLKKFFLAVPLDQLSYE